MSSHEIQQRERPVVVQLEVEVLRQFLSLGDIIQRRSHKKGLMVASMSENGQLNTSDTDDKKKIQNRNHENKRQRQKRHSASYPC
jgi:hypothetical protein